MFFERPGGGEQAVLVHLEGQNPEAREDPQEFQELVRSAGAETVAFVSVSRHQPSAKYLIGSGKVEELHDLVKAENVELVIFNHTLTPSQERNLERAFECRVLDRTGLILDIFAQRARTHEGKLQVELAQLEHMSTRLVRGWTHLERQKGGIGLRGPGETQLETDRRLLRVRIRQIKQRLEKVRSQREQARRGRKRADIPAVSLVGYTNAGKSTLFNSLTASEVYAANQLFATLDPTLRRLQLDDLGPVVLADTVGFIRHLPHKLVEAFRATLEESSNADLLLHVIDAYEPNGMRRSSRCWRCSARSAPTNCRCSRSITRLTCYPRSSRTSSATTPASRCASGCRRRPAKASTCCARPSPSCLARTCSSEPCACPSGSGACAPSCSNWARCSPRRTMRRVVPCCRCACRGPS